MDVPRGYGDSGATRVVEVLDLLGGAVVVAPVGAGRTTLLVDVAGSEQRRDRAVRWRRGRRRGGSSGDVDLVADGSGRLVADLAARPTTILVDDAQWLADDEIDALVALAERRTELGVRLVVARRPVRLTAPLAALETVLLGPPGALHLGPLAVPEIVTWARAVGVEDADGTGAEVAEATGGWPDLVAAALGADRPPAAALGDLVRARLCLLEPVEQRVLGAAVLGLAPGGSALLDACEVDAATVDRALDAARAEGLLHADPLPVPAVARIVRETTDGALRDAVARAARRAPAGVRVAVAGHLLRLDDRSAATAELLSLAVADAAGTTPELALAMHDHAVGISSPPPSLGRDAARAALAAGAPERVVELLVDADPRDPEHRRLMAAAWAHLGRPGVAGDDSSTAPPDDVTGAATGWRDGWAAWERGEVASALAAFRRSAHACEVVDPTSTWTDTPHAAGALVAGQALEHDLAAQLAEAAVARRIGGTAYAARHRLLAGFVAARTARLDAARDALDGTDPRVPRDVLTAAALEAALALRGGGDDLTAVWGRIDAASAVADFGSLAADLVAEVAQVAARVGADPEAVMRQVADDRAPQPVLVSAAWARALVALLRDDAAAARTAAAALDAEAGSSAAAQVLAPAAHVLARVLDGHVEPDAVRAASAALAERGLLHEAARLVGAAAVRTDDPAVARRLLGESRSLRGSVRRQGRRGAVEPLSDREREVGRAVLEGRSHREIGQALFISAKTVEHHVAHIRQKLGATSRAELLAALRDELGGDGAPATG